MVKEDQSGQTVSSPSKLGPAERAEAIRALKETELDILVVGGGIVGTGSAVDAVTRGLSVGLVEARDFASGTSSRSSKLVHGGIRYLEQLDFRLVREALIERGLLLQRIAPHLVKPVRFLYPLKKRVVERAYVGAGMMLYDIFSYTGLRPPGVPHHRHLSKRQVMRAIPSLASDALVGGITYYDAQVDDARYVANLARTAAHYGAHVASRVRVEGFIKVGERVVGVRAHDLENDERFDIRAKQVVNATGVWTDDTQAMVGERGQFKVRASKGIHLVVPRDRFQSKMGLLLRTEKSVLFVIPWGRHWLIGTTDTDWHLDKAHPAATAADIDYLLEHVNAVVAVPLTREDVEGVYAGLRPLLAGESEETSKLSREHLVAHSVPGLVVIAGGKWTTYRIMAKDAIDSAVDALDGKIPESTTQEIALVGAEGYQAAWNSRGRIAAKTGLHIARIEHLLNRYGTLSDDLFDLIRSDPSLAEPLPGADDYIGAEVVYAASHEGALHLEDVLARRTRISIEAWDRGVSAAPVAASLMAAVLGWDAKREEHEVQVYLKRVAAERASQLQPDDESAEAIRLEAPEIVSA
ncbi:glycerol-3-phosphate dehydrogenase/oxidase [Diaminobutyricibacter tongyongensis]|uniref:glycerol-3-phosphate dehydrogenase/oxidase n=1 Tax=Leifsonia tongyongensis TaxID=1268043 RepID=UPI001878570B|nr:glycerol-3-phosphate dehydrogenase/oxidase [Diaminobutyricibacter tongyongensis]